MAICNLTSVASEWRTMLFKISFTTMNTSCRTFPSTLSSGQAMGTLKRPGMEEFADILLRVTTEVIRQ